jgi:hypothetical protein
MQRFNTVNCLTGHDDIARVQGNSAAKDTEEIRLGFRFEKCRGWKRMEEVRG